jgi:hypothetical protein
MFRLFLIAMDALTSAEREECQARWQDNVALREKAIQDARSPVTRGDIIAGREIYLRTASRIFTVRS